MVEIELRTHTVERLMQGPLFSVERRRYTTNDGRTAVRDVVVHPGAVVVLPRLGSEAIVMIRNTRYAVGRVLLELPAGTLEPGEEPAECARRELLEETGYNAGRIEPFGEFFTSPGILTELMRAYLADELTPATQTLDEGEQISVEVVPTAEARRMVAEGRIMDAKTLAVLGRYFLQRG